MEIYFTDSWFKKVIVAIYSKAYAQKKVYWGSFNQSVALSTQYYLNLSYLYLFQKFLFFFPESWVSFNSSEIVELKNALLPSEDSLLCLSWHWSRKSIAHAAI